MDPNDYHNRGTREEWREAIKKLHDLKGQAAGRAAIDLCKEMLADTPDPDVSRETVPCEHDYQPNTRYLEAMECVKCGAICEAIGVAVDADWYDEDAQNQGK